MSRNIPFVRFCLRCLARVTQWGLAEVTHTENGMGNGFRYGGSSSTPKACSLVGSIEEQAISSTP
jgi:hypothetical protein